MMPYRILLGMTLQMFQQLTGANYVCHRTKSAMFDVER